MGYKIVIPARYASQRLPGKPLLDIVGKPMVQRVYERACETGATQIIVATDDERIAEVCRKFGAQVCMTASTHPSGTDRLEEVARQLNLADEEIVINLQGDEPLMPAIAIEQVAKNLIDNPHMAIATLCEEIEDERQLHNPAVVKVIFAQNGRALYFSRAPVPFARDVTDQSKAYRHLGIYAYRVKLLHDYVTWPQAEIERCEKLEQLRALYQGEDIHLALACASIPPGVDTEEDLLLVRDYFTRQSEHAK